MSKIILGKLEYNDKAYHFLFQDNIITIVQQAFEYKNDFENQSETEVIHGVTDNNCDIYFLKCKFHQNVFRTNTRITVKAYVIINAINVQTLNFDRMVFYSDSLNVFYPPKMALEKPTSIPDFDAWDGSIHPKTKPFEDTKFEFFSADAKCELNFARHENCEISNPVILTANAYFAFNFNSSKEIEELCKYYLILNDFLTFVNKCHNISFSNVKLQQKNSDGEYTDIGNFYAVVHDKKYTRTYKNSITFQDIPSEKFALLFDSIIKLRDEDNRFHLYFSEDEESERYVDSIKWLTAASCFEGLFSTVYKDYKTNDNENFRKAKDKVLSLLKSFEESEDYSTNFTKKEKRYFRDFIEDAERNEGMLEAKFNKVFNENKDALTDVLRVIKNNYNFEDNVNWGQKYASYRNKLAHGSVDIIDDEKWAIYRLLEPMVYILLLNELQLNSDELKTILNKLFV